MKNEVEAAARMLVSNFGAGAPESAGAVIAQSWIYKYGIPSGKVEYYAEMIWERYYELIEVI